MFGIMTWTRFKSCLCSDMIMKWSCFYLDPSWSQSGLVWCWDSLKLFSFNTEERQDLASGAKPSQSNTRDGTRPAVFLLSQEGLLSCWGGGRKDKKYTQFKEATLRYWPSPCMTPTWSDSLRVMPLSPALPHLCPCLWSPLLFLLFSP